jgi:hypothetical protein
MKFFEMFGGMPKEERATDGAGHIAIPEGGNDEKDIK